MAIQDNEQYTLSGAQVKDIVAKIKATASASGNSAPTSSTEGTLGQTYVDESTGDIYYLESIDETTAPYTYNWTKLNGLSEDTTFWGQTVSNGAVKGNMTFGTGTMIYSKDDNNSTKGGLGFYDGAFILTGSLGNYIRIRTSDASGTDKQNYMNINNVQAPRGGLTGQSDCATKEYVDSKMLIAESPFPDAIFNEIIGD